MDPSNNTETEEETIALKKKRARRVSFADNEITSVHIFRRDDEDSESPLESTKTNSSADRENPENDVLGFFRDLGGDSDEEDLKEQTPARNAGGNGNDNGDGEAADVRNSFLKPIGSPSPGSSTVGSVASTDDEDEFHGPVSASFIRPGQLADSAASDDDNHDLTMDSTAFSLHYRSLAWSDSGDLKTPTRFAIPFEEKTFRQTSGPTAPGSFMELTKVTKLSPQPLVPADTASASRDSNDMSIVGVNPHRYDYHRLSPSIVAILAEGSKDLPASSALDSNASDLLKQSKAFRTSQNKNEVRSPSDSATDDTAKYDMLVAASELGELNRYSTASPFDGVNSDLLINKGDNTVAEASIHEIQTPDCSIKGIEECVKVAIEPGQKQLDFAATKKKSPLEVDDCYYLVMSAKHDLGYHYSSESQVEEISPKDTGHASDIDHKQVDGNLIRGSTPSSVAGREQLLMGSSYLSRHTGALTSPLKLPGSFLFKEYVTNGETLSSIHENISKLESLGNSSRTSSLREGIDRSKCRLSKYYPGSILINRKGREYNHIGTPNAHLKDELFIGTPNIKGQQNLIIMDNHGTESLRNSGKSCHIEETVKPKGAGEPYRCITADISYDGKNPTSMEMKDENTDFELANGTVENMKDENAVVMQKKCVSSPMELLDQKLLPSLGNQNNCFSTLKHLGEQNESANSGLGHSSKCSSQTTIAEQLDMSISGNSEKSSSAVEVAEAIQFSEAIYRRKLAESSAKNVLVLSTHREGIVQSPIHEASALLPSMQEPPSESLHCNIQNLSPMGNSDGPVDNYHQTHQAQVAESPFNEFCMENCSGKKRKGIELLRDGKNIDKIGRIDSRPNVRTSGNMNLQIILEQSDDVRSDRQKLGEKIWKNSFNILEEFSRRTKQLLCPSADKLNLTMIGMLEDILVHIKRVKKCEILCSEIHSQKITETLRILRHKRVMKTRMLLYNITYDKAKLQLMHMKHEILQKKVQQLSFGLQESQMLKSYCTPCSSKIVATNSPAKVQFFYGLINSEGKRQTMRQELESLVCKAKFLSKFLHSCCKLEGGQSCADTITLVLDYLKKQMSYKRIFQNLQIWEIDNFKHKDGCYEVFLNYCGYLIQRFMVNTGSPTIIISNNFNDQNIVKTFPGMDILAAFAFVINPDTSKKCNGSRCLARETQITNSLLSNLLDVVEEVQLAKIEIKNLVQAKFYSQSVGELDLLLSFIDFNTGSKLKVVFDMTCLKCGAYPVEILPSHIYDVTSGEQKPSSVSLEADIRTAAERVKVGYSRIMRLCTAISQAVQAFAPGP